MPFHSLLERSFAFNMMGPERFYFTLVSLVIVSSFIPGVSPLKPNNTVSAKCIILTDHFESVSGLVLASHIFTVLQLSYGLFEQLIEI